MFDNVNETIDPSAPRGRGRSVARPPHGTRDAAIRTMRHPNPESGKVGYALAWILGIPLPILLVVYLISRC
jgi:hypothetical protein